MAKVRNSPPSGNATNEAMQAWNMQFPTSAGGTFGGIKIPPQGNPNAAIDTITLRGIHGEIKNLNMGLALSFEGLNQGIQSLVELQEKSIIADKKEDSDDDKDKARALAKADAKNIENERESRLGKMGGSLKEGAGAVKQGVQKAASGFSIGGFLTTLIGGALLGAIFAPEKFDKAVKAITGAVTDVVNNEFLRNMAKGLIGSLDWDNLFVTGIFGWRVGAIYSGFKYLGTALADAIGLKETGDDTGSEQTLGSKVQGYLRDGIIGAFGALGIVGALFPALIFKGIGAMGRGLGGIFRTSAGIDAKGGATLPAEYKTAADTEGKAVQKSFMSKIMGTVKGKGGLIGIALAAMAAVAAVLSLSDEESKKTAEDAGNEMKKGLNLMSTGLKAAAEGAMEWAGTGAMIGMMFGPIGLVIGTVVGGLLGAAIGILSLTDEEKAKFAKGIATVWDSMIEKFTNVIADMLQFLLPSFMIPDWVKKAKSTEQEKLASTTAKVAQSNEKVAASAAAATTKTGDKITDEQRAKMAAITADTPHDVEKQLNKIVPGLTSESRNKLGRVIAQRNRDVETQREAKANIGAEERGLTSDINDFQKEIDKEKLKVVKMKDADAAVRDRIIGEVDPGGVMDPADIEKMMVGHKDKNEAEIKKSEKRIAALQEGKIAAEGRRKELTDRASPTLSSVPDSVAALVGEASASQSSAAMNVIMMNNGGGPQSAAAASGTTVNNNTVKSDSNISLYSMNEENRAAYAHLSRFGALG